MLIRFLIAGCLTWFLFGTAPLTVLGWQSPETGSAPVTTDASADTAARALAQEATRLQNAGNFPNAANQWQKIIATYPNWPQRGIAWLNLGICNVSQGRFADSFEPLKKSLQLSGNPNDTPKALMFLGYAQLNHGHQLSASPTPADQQNSQIYLTTATQTLGKIVNNFPDFELVDQALYFRGQSFYKLNRLNEAIAAFEKVSQITDATFRKDALFDLATTYQRQQEFSLANAAYDDYLAAVENDDATAVVKSEARLKTAKAKLELAAAAESQANDQQAKLTYQNVIQMLAPIAENEKSDQRDQATFNQALAAAGLGDSRKSAELFESVIAIPDSKLAQQAAVLAGRERLAIEQFDQAIALLRPIAQSNSRFGAEAAIFLSTALRLTNNPKSAIEITQRWIDAVGESTGEAPLMVPLLMEQADAMYSIAARKKEAAALYQTIATDFPDSPAVGDAMYKSAAVYWETFATNKAVELAKQFIKLYPLHPSIPGARSILADAAIADKRFGEGESIYRKLMIDFPNAPQAGQWALRIGWALFLQDKFQDARDHLMGQIDTIGVPTLQSEAFHWIGESEFALKNYQGAIAALNQALESTQPWDRLDTTLFVRLQSELELGLLGDAKATLEVLKNDYPNSNLTAEAMLRTAEIYFDQQQFAESANQYQTIITQYPNTDFLPSALYGLGWAQLRSDQLAQSESTFDRLIEAFPTTKLSQQARVGRSIAQRRLGKTEQAITDLIAFIESAPAGERKNNSLLELGLAYVQNENWAEAESTFTRLLAIKPKTSFSDRVHYELAWVLQNRNQPDLSLEQFKQLLKNYPASDLAPEAFFEVASDAYQRKQFETAAEFFERGLSSITNLESAANTSLSNDTPTAKTSDFDSPYVDLKQKTFYQLGWAKYKLKDFPSAASHFQRLTDTFPDAELAADATFMLGQSHFQSDNFQAALSAYQSALDKIKTRNSSSDVVSPQRRLLLLHGAQSANQIGKFATAIELATPLTLIPVSETVGPEIAMQHAAWLEIAKSRLGLEQFDGAKDAFQRAAVDLGRTGAQARVMKADLLLQQNQFQDAINEYKLVFYGYGGTKSTGEIRALQAYAIYETARANYSRIAQASPAMRDQLINDSLKHFDYLIENYSDQPLADDAKQTVAELKLLRQP